MNYNFDYIFSDFFYIFFYFKMNNLKKEKKIILNYYISQLLTIYKQIIPYL